MKVDKKGNQIFTKRELLEKLNFTEEQADIVMQYQKKLPILLGEYEGFSINARELWVELGEPQGEFNKWIKRKMKNKGFEPFKDYVEYLQMAKNSLFDNSVENQNQGGRPSTEYKLTIDTAKEVAMMDNSEMGKLVRRYFIQVERALKDYEQWELIRNPQKEGYKEMSKEVKKTYFKKNDKMPPYFMYSNEADMLNKALLGYTAKKTNELLDSKDKNTREHFNATINQAIHKLQIMNIALIKAELDYQMRKDIIIDYCNENYAELKDEFEKLINVENIENSQN